MPTDVQQKQFKTTCNEQIKENKRMFKLLHGCMFYAI